MAYTPDVSIYLRLADENKCLKQENEKLRQQNERMVELINTALKQLERQLYCFCYKPHDGGDWVKCYCCAAVETLKEARNYRHDEQR